MRLTRKNANGGYETEPTKVYEVINKLGKIEDWLENIENNAIPVCFEEIKEEVVPYEV